MHTSEQAKQLWCPMARVAQVGALETGAAYNRALVKAHIPVKLASAAPEDFELGKDPEPVMATMLKTETQISAASHCLADRCAMWRWASAKYGVEGYCGLAGIPFVL